jgi:hypothetical protein
MIFLRIHRGHRFCLIRFRILDPSKLAIQRRNAGVGESGNYSSSQMNVDETNGYVIASNQTSFSQWAILSNVGENTFIDVQAPVVTTTTVTPVSPSILGDITVQRSLMMKPALTVPVYISGWAEPQIIRTY